MRMQKRPLRLFQFRSGGETMSMRERPFLKISYKISHVVVTIALFFLGTFPAREVQAQSLDDTGVLGINSVKINKDVVVNADVVGNDASSGPTLDGGVELSIGQGATINGNAIADSILLNKNANVTLDFLCNEIEDKNNPPSAPCSAITLPVFDPLPVFQQFQGDQIGPDVNVPSGGSATLDAGGHGDVTVGSNATLTLTGGIYNIRSLTTGQNSSVVIEGPSDIRLEGNLTIGKDSVVGDAAIASQTIFYVGGSNVLGPPPNAANIGSDTNFFGNIYAPNGTLNLEKGILATGAFFGQDVNIDQPSTGPSGRTTTINLDTAFGNKPPVADPQTVTTNGANPLLITLTGSDPEGGDLTFSIVSGGEPINGTLSAITPIVPAPIPNPNPPPATVQPPVTSATVTYTPNTGNDLEDMFTFQVADPEGLVGTAIVTINPVDPSPPPPPLAEVEATNIEVDTTVNTAVEIVLDAGAPETVTSLTFSIESLPAGTLTDSNGSDILVPGDLPGPILTYQPPLDFTGADSFDFKARDSANAADFDTATVLIGVAEAQELAEDQTVTTNLNESISFTLEANPDGVGTPKSLLIAGKASTSNSPAAAGAVIDSNLSGSGNFAATGIPLMSAAIGAAGSTTGCLAGEGGLPEYTGGDITVEVLAKDADFVAELGLYSALGGSRIDLSSEFGTPYIALSNEAVGTLRTFNPGDFSISSGGPIIFGIRIQQTGQTFFMGNGTGNPSGFGHARIIDQGNDVFVGEFEDTVGGGDCDFNDARFEFSGGLFPPVIGERRAQIEWPIGTLSFDSEDGGESAQIILTTEKGEDDTLDTQFFVGDNDQDGSLTPSDFQALATELDGVLMPVPPGALTGDVGTFAFDVTGELQAAVNQGDSFFSVQGRVDAPGRGLQVRTTGASAPQLVITTPDPPTQLVWTILTLPAEGTVSFNGTPVTVGQTFTSEPTLEFTSSVAGTFSLTYEVTQDGVVTDTATVTFMVSANDSCVIVGREVGCSPSF